MIAADGGSSTVAQMLDPVGRANLKWSFAVQDLYECACDLEPGYWHYFVDPKISWYPCAYRKDGFLIMDVALKSEEKAFHHIERFKNFLKHRFGFRDATLLRRMGCRVTFPAPQRWFHFGTNRILLAGEAGGLFNLFGEGISSAMASGAIAGQVSAKSIHQKTPPGSMYRKEIEPERFKTAQQFTLKSMLSDSRMKDALRNIPLLNRPIIMKDMIKWLFFINKMGQGGLPNG